MLAFLLACAVCISTANVILAIFECWHKPTGWAWWRTGFLLAGAISVFGSATIQLEVMQRRVLGLSMPLPLWGNLVIVTQFVAAVFQCAFLLILVRQRVVKKTNTVG